MLNVHGSFCDWFEQCFTDVADDSNCKLESFLVCLQQSAHLVYCWSAVKEGQCQWVWKCTQLLQNEQGNHTATKCPIFLLNSPTLWFFELPTIQCVCRQQVVSLLVKILTIKFKQATKTHNVLCGLYWLLSQVMEKTLSTGIKK